MKRYVQGQSPKQRVNEMNMKTKSSIKEIRAAVDNLNIERQKIETFTNKEEFKQMNVPEILGQLIKKCLRLEISPLFSREVTACNAAIERANETISRWFSENSKLPGIRE